MITLQDIDDSLNMTPVSPSGNARQVAPNPSITLADIDRALQNDNASALPAVVTSTSKTNLLDDILNPIIQSGDVGARILYGLGTGAAAIPVGLYNLAAKYSGLPQGAQVSLPPTYESGMENIRKMLGIAPSTEQTPAPEYSTLQTLSRIAGGALLPGAGAFEGTAALSSMPDWLSAALSGATSGAVGAPAYSAAFSQTTPKEDIRNAITGALTGGVLAPAASVASGWGKFLLGQKALKSMISSLPEEIKSVEGKIADAANNKDEIRDAFLNSIKPTTPSNTPLSANRDEMSQILGDFTNNYDNLTQSLDDKNSSLSSLKDNILQNLSNGEHGTFGALSKNRKDFADLLSKKYWEQYNAAKNDYNDFFSKDNIGNQDIYGGTQETPLSFQDAIEQRNFLSEKKRAFARMLGAQEHSEYVDASNQLDALDNQINQFMSQHEGLADDYGNLQQKYKESVVPFKKSADIRKIASNVIQDPSDLTSIFRNPTDFDMQVVNMLGDEGKDRILYDYLGNPTISQNIDSFAKSIPGLDKKGMIDYLSPSMRDSLKNYADTYADKLDLEEQLPRAKKVASVARAISNNPSGIGDIASRFSNRDADVQNVISQATRKGANNILYDLFGRPNVSSNDVAFQNAIDSLDASRLKNIMSPEQLAQVTDYTKSLDDIKNNSAKLDELKSTLKNSQAQYKMGSIMKKLGIGGGLGASYYLAPKIIRKLLGESPQERDYVYTGEDNVNR